MSEATEQAALFQFLATMEGRYPDLRWAFHPANEANGGGPTVRVRNRKLVPIEAVTNARMGVRKGVPDVLMPIGNQEALDGEYYNGLAIELKVGRNDVTDEQAAWLECLQLNRWRTLVCRDWRDAARLLLRWVGGDPSEVEGL